MIIMAITALVALVASGRSKKTCRTRATRGRRTPFISSNHKWPTWRTRMENQWANNQSVCWSVYRRRAAALGGGIKNHRFQSRAKGAQRAFNSQRWCRYYFGHVGCTAAWSAITLHVHQERWGARYAQRGKTITVGQGWSTQTGATFWKDEKAIRRHIGAGVALAFIAEMQGAQRSTGVLYDFV